LRRSLSRASSLHRVATGQKSIKDANDDDDFDLKEYLVRQRLSPPLSLIFCCTPLSNQVMCRCVGIH